MVRSVSCVLAFAAVVGACASEPSAPVAPACDAVELVVSASDYTYNVICGAPGCEKTPATTGSDLGQGATLSSSNGRTFLVAWLTNRLYEVDPRCGVPTKRIDLASVLLVPRGDRRVAPNPHDAAAAPDGTVWSTFYDRGTIGIVEAGGEIAELDLASHDEDGNPQPEAIAIVDLGAGPKAFVALEVLDDAAQLSSRRPSKMLRIDVATRAVEAVVELAGRNPFNPMQRLDRMLFLAEPGNFDTLDEPLAGIERFDTTTSTTRLLVPERDLGGSVSQVAVTEGCGAAIVAGPGTQNPTALATFDPSTGAVLTTYAAPTFGPTSGYDLVGLAWRGDLLYVGDRRPIAGGYPVRVFRRAGPGCALVDTGRTILLPEAPIALLPALPEAP